MGQIIYELDGIKYLLVEYPVMQSTNKKNLVRVCEDYGIIFQGIEYKCGGLFKKRAAAIRLLVPEKNVILFNADKRI